MGISEAVRQSLVFVLFHFHARFAHGIGTRLKLAVERVARAIGEERRRNPGCPELLYIGRCDAQPAVEGVDHADGAYICRHLVERIGTVAGCECCAIYQSVEIERVIVVENPSGREAHIGDFIRFNPIIGSVPTERLTSTLVTPSTALMLFVTVA